VADQCARTNRHWLPGMARFWIGRHSGMASPDKPLSSCICAHRLWYRPLSGSHLHCQHGARLDSLALVLDCFLRRSIHRRGRKLRHWISAAVGGFRCGTDVRALDRNNSSAACSRNPRPGQMSDVFIVVALWGGFWALVHDLRDRKDLSLGTGSNQPHEEANGPIA